jgi:predicted acyl esterase
VRLSPRVLLALVTAVLSIVGIHTATVGAARTPYPGGEWSPEPARYGAAIDPIVLVPMDDGVQIRVEVIYPTDPDTGDRARGSFPVLITQTPYSTNLGVTGNIPTCQDSLDSLSFDGIGPCPGSYFVKRGYIVVQSDQRGTGLSGGNSWGMFGPRDAQDGAELVRWAANDKNVPGSNGTIGLFGCSALGISQLVTAAALGRDAGTHHPVKAMVPGCITGGMYRDTYFDNGIPSMIVAASTAQAGLDAWRAPLGLPMNQPPADPQGPNILSGGDQAYERQFWKQRKIADEAADIVRSGIPALIYVGWKEGGHIGGLDLYTQLQNVWAGRDQFASMKAGQPVTGRYQLFIGDGAHGCCLGDPGVQLQFFDHWLKGEKTGIDATTRTPMHVQELGTDRYVNLSTYPWTTDYTPYRLGDGTLAPSLQKGGSDQLIWGPAADGTTSRTYTSSALKQGVTIAGSMSLTLYASSSNTNLQIAATVFDVAPGGTATEISHGSLVGSLSDLDESRSWTNTAGVVYRPYPRFDWDRYQPSGDVIRYDVPIAPKLYALAPGHSIRLTLSTQGDTQACLASANIGPPPLGCLYTAPQLRTLPGGSYEVKRDARHPTALNLPLLPYRTFPTVASDVTPTSGGEQVPQDWG